MKKNLIIKGIGDIGMSNTFKILANSLFGVMMTRVEKFKDFKIVTKESHKLTSKLKNQIFLVEILLTKI